MRSLQVALIRQVRSRSAVRLVRCFFCHADSRFRSGRRGFWTLFGNVSNTSTEKTKIIGETTDSFRRSDFSVFTKFVTHVRRSLVGVPGGQPGVTRSGWVFVS